MNESFCFTPHINQRKHKLRNQAIETRTRVEIFQPSHQRDQTETIATTAARQSTAKATTTTTTTTAAAKTLATELTKHINNETRHPTLKRNDLASSY